MTHRETAMCRGRHRINNDLQKPQNITDKKTNTSVSCMRHHVCSESLYTAAVFCNPVGHSQCIPHWEIAHHRSDRASPWGHSVRLPSCHNSEISTPPLNLPLFSSHLAGKCEYVHVHEFQQQVDYRTLIADQSVKSIFKQNARNQMDPGSKTERMKLFLGLT